MLRRPHPGDPSSQCGPSAARNIGAGEARGALLAFLDSDDLWHPSKLERQAGLLERAGRRMCCCICNATLIEEGRGCIGRSFDKAGIEPRLAEGEWTNPQEILASRFVLFNQTMIVRRDAFHKAGGYDNRLRLLEDYELAVRLTNQGRWGFIRDPLVRKYNSPAGTGVACMNDATRHNAVCASVITGILGSGIRLSSEARDLFEQALDDLRNRERARLLQSSADALTRTRGRAEEFRAKTLLWMRRRSSSWPRFGEHPVGSGSLQPS
jgi:glycosyltransferase involved in cell wall biosynthesis